VLFVLLSSKLKQKHASGNMRIYIPLAIFIAGYCWPDIPVIAIIKAAGWVPEAQKKLPTAIAN
jgi:hypothetical protein